jgi:hypothetical protein
MTNDILHGFDPIAYLTTPTCYKPPYRIPLPKKYYKMQIWEIQNKKNNNSKATRQDYEIDDYEVNK